MAIDTRTKAQKERAIKRKENRIKKEVKEKTHLKIIHNTYKK